LARHSRRGSQPWLPRRPMIAREEGALPLGAARPPSCSTELGNVPHLRRTSRLRPLSTASCLTSRKLVLSKVPCSRRRSRHDVAWIDADAAIVDHHGTSWMRSIAVWCLASRTSTTGSRSRPGVMIVRRAAPCASLDDMWPDEYMDHECGRTQRCSICSGTSSSQRCGW
jgi:hypothetical protein